MRHYQQVPTAHGQAHKILVIVASGSSQCSDKLAHLLSLATAFAAHIHKVPVICKATVYLYVNPAFTEVFS